MTNWTSAKSAEHCISEFLLKTENQKKEKSS